MAVCDKIKQVMADYVMLRKGRNVLSTIVHAILNVALAVTSTAVTVISASIVVQVACRGGAATLLVVKYQG